MGKIVKPACCTNIIKKFIIRQEDDAGVYHNCETWGPKAPPCEKSAEALLKRASVMIRKYKPIPKYSTMLDDVEKFFGKEMREEDIGFSSGTGNTVLGNVYGNNVGCGAMLSKKKIREEDKTFMKQKSIIFHKREDCPYWNRVGTCEHKDGPVYCGKEPVGEPSVHCPCQDA